MIEQSVSLASNGVVKVPGYEQLVRFGYTKNRGVYRLAVSATGEWEGLAIRAFWHVPDSKDPASSLVVDGYVAVPASVTAQPGSGCITFEGSDDTKNITSADLHYRVSANSGTEDGTEPEPGTPAWQQLVDAVHTDATTAEQAKTDAQTAAQQAATSAGNAKQSAQEAADSLQELKDGIANGDFKGEPGNDGKSPVVTVTDIENGHRVSITDKDGTKTIDVLNGQTGKTGATPVLTIGTVSSGDKPFAYITGTPENPVLNLMLQPGPQGPAVALDTTLTHEGEAADAKATGDAISAVKVRQNVLVGTETGNPIAVDDAFPAPLCGLTVYGRSTQAGTPTPDAPVPIVSAGESGSVAVKVTGKNLFYEQEFQEYFINSVANTVGLATGNVSCVLQVVTGAKYYVTRNKIGTKFRVAVVDKLPTLGNPVTPSSGINADSKRQAEISATSKYMVIQCEDEAAFSELMVSLDSSTTYSPYREQLLTLPTPNGLPGIPVTSGGNYTDPQGQQWVCDEVDLERGVKVQRVKVLNLLNSSGFDNNGTWHIATNQLGAGTSYTPLEWFTPAIKCLCNTFPVQMSKYQTGTDANLSIYYSQTGDVITLKSALFNPKGQRATVDEAKAWFTAHPTYLYVPIEPIETPLTPAEIAAYKALTAYGPDTVVQAGDGAGIRLAYQRDVNIAIKRIEDAIASMT